MRLSSNFSSITLAMLLAISNTGQVYGAPSTDTGTLDPMVKLTQALTPWPAHVHMFPVP
jgi:hypothetical protein